MGFPTASLVGLPRPAAKYSHGTMAVQARTIGKRSLVQTVQLSARCLPGQANQKKPSRLFLPSSFLATLAAKLLASLQLDTYQTRPHHAKFCPALHPVVTVERQAFLCLTFVSHVQEGRWPPEGRSIRVVRSFSDAPETIGRWRLANVAPISSKSPSCKRTSPQNGRDYDLLQQDRATYQREHVRQRQRKRPRDAQTRTRIVRS